jgi:hypothetical protein
VSLANMARGGHHLTLDHLGPVVGNTTRHCC